jgi:phospholipid-binding lipoprotein MlaA
MRRETLNAIFARGFVLLHFTLLMHGCASAPVQKGPIQPAERPVSEFVKPNVTYPIDAYDPLERINRRIYKFNALFDRYVYLPVLRAYEFVLPVPVQDMVSSFFNNLHDVRSLVNSVLQLKGAKACITGTRMFVNTTLGIGGLFDAATGIGIPKQNEDFGQTLGFYGLGPGAYIVLPIFGPSSVRDTGGLVFDLATYDVMTNEMIQGGLDLNGGEESALTWGSNTIDAIDTRRQQSFRYYQTGSPFEYELIRGLYLRSRQLYTEN